MTKSKDEPALSQQMEELRDRMKVLQNDRRANIDILESNKTANKEEIKRLREDNKQLRQKLSNLQKTTVNETSDQEQKHLEREVENLRKEYDRLKIHSARLKKEFDSLKDSVRDLELDSKRPHMEDNAQTRHIRSLENKLDKAMIKYNEAQGIRKTYEQIVKRLNEERVGFDNQLTAIERTLSAKQKDYEELLLLSGDANHARENALNELERVRAVYDGERKKREKELRERHQMVQLRRQMLERIKQREKLREELVQNQETNRLNHTMNSTNGASQSSMLEKIENRNKVDIFENAFRKIKEATGVSDVNEVINKIISQESTTENLIFVTRENQGKIESLNQLKKKIKLHCEELKYSSVAGSQHRKMVDHLEDQLANSATRLERSRIRYERLSKLIISMKAGIGHLQDKLESFREEIRGKTFNVSDETVSDILRECEICFSTLNTRIKAFEEEIKRNRLMDFAASTTDANPYDSNQGKDFSGTSSSEAKPMLLANEDMAAQTQNKSSRNSLLNELDDTASKLNTLRPYNQRIDLSLSDEFAQFDLGGASNGIVAGASAINDESSIGDLDDDELTRDKIKRASNQILLAMDKKKKKNKKKTTANSTAADDRSQD